MTEQSVKEYTQEKFDAIWEIIGYKDEDVNVEVLLSIINDPNFFRSFSERLLAFYNNAIDNDMTAEEASADLLFRAKMKNIGINRNTIRNWFSGKSEPKYGSDDRKRLFTIAFALELDCSGTEKFFNKVYLDRAFNKRNVEEFIYLFCIFNRKEFSDAEAIIMQISRLSEADILNDQTEESQFLNNVAQHNVGVEEIISWVVSHPHNFALSNTAAKRHVEKHLKELTGTENNIGLVEREFIKRRREFRDLKDAECDESDDIAQGRSKKSIDFLLYMIYGYDTLDLKKGKYKTIHDIFTRKEISTQFPNKDTLSQTDPSAYILRKNIIFLYFYHYWVSDYLSGKNEGDIDGFNNGIDDVLYECGYSPLYAGNPYDWLFLYCSASGRDDYSPLDIFRIILAQDTEIED